ncbi:MAG: hypothetical protein GY778_05735 [bacterium]|nr:hypothetical protein [bacterium]
MPRNWGGLTVLLFIVCALGCGTRQPLFAQQDVPPDRGQIAGVEGFSDSHVHLIDFLQNGAFDNSDGRFPGVGERGEIENIEPARYLALPYGEQWRRLTLFLKDMQTAGVDHAMVSGMPFLKKWSANEPFGRPKYYLDSSSRMVRARDTDYLIGAAVVDYKRKFADNAEQLRKLGRLYPFVCGFDGTDLGAVDLVIKRIKEFPGVWKGIGEVMSRHDDLTNLTTGERPRADHPALKRLCRFAGGAFLPVSIHHNIAPISRSPNEIKEPVYLDELVELFDYCRPPHAKHETKFIWCHAGISRRIVVEELPHWISAVLDRFEGQVYVDLSWVVYEDYILKDLESWAALIKKYPESFMLGSDVVGGGQNLDKEFRRLQALLDTISTDEGNVARRNLVRDNFVRLMSDLRQQQHAKMLNEELISTETPESIGLILKTDFEYDQKAHTGARERSFMLENKPAH